MPPQGQQRYGKSSLLSGILVLAAILGAGLAISAFRASQANAGLAVNSADLNFGTQWESDAFTWTVPIANTSEQPLEIEGWQVSCSCTKASPPRLTIPPGQSRNLTLTLNLSAAFADDSVADAAPFSVQIQPRIKGAPVFAGWEVTGLVERAIRFDPQELAATVLEPEPLTVTVHSQVPINRKHIEAPATLFASTQLLPGENEGTFVLEFIPKTNLPPDVYHTKIVLRAASQEERISPASLPVRLTIPGPVTITPKKVAFGGITPDEPHTETLLLKTRDPKTPVRLIIRHGADVSVRCQTAEAFSNTHKIQVTANYRLAGGHTGVMEIITENKTGRRTTHSIPLRAYVLKSRGIDAANSLPVEAPRPR